MARLFNKTNHHPTMHTRHRNRLNMAVAMVITRTAANPSNLVNTTAIRTVDVGGVSHNSIKARSNILNTLNNTNKLIRMHSCVVDEEVVEALPTMGHHLSRDASYTIQHRNPKTLSLKASISMGSLHVRFRSLK